MIPTFNPKNYNEVTCAKMVIGCHTDFKGSITIGRGQTVIRHHIFSPLGGGDYDNNLYRPDGLDWHLVVANDNEGTTYIIPTKNPNYTSTFGDTYIRILLADEPITYNVYYVLLNKSTGAIQPAPYKEVFDAFGNQAPVTLLFEIC